jgi:hypothetical protein
MVVISSSIMAATNILNASAYLLYKNPILFLLPSIGSVISIVSEAFFVIGLHNNNNQNYFPFSDIVVLFLFFISFTIAYFQLFIARKVILKTAIKTRNYYYHVIIIELLIIYSIYALVLSDIGDNESDMRKSLASVKSDRFSLYTAKINSYNYNTISIIVPFGILIVLLSTIISVFFNAWMVQYVLIGDQNMDSSGRHGLYKSLKNIVSITIEGNDEGKKKEVASLFILTTLISITGFVLTNIAVFPIADGLSLYLLQFVVLNIIGAVYLPFFLVCLFLTFLQ